MLGNPEHPIAVKLTTTRRTMSAFKFDIPIPKTEAYKNSFIQQHLKTIRDEAKHKQSRSHRHPKTKRAVSQMRKTIRGYSWSQSAPKIVQSHTAGLKQTRRQQHCGDKNSLNLKQ